MQTLRLRESELKSDYAQTNTTLGPNHPKVIELSNRMKALDGSIQLELKRLAARAHGEYLAAGIREQRLRAAAFAVGRGSAVAPSLDGFAVPPEAAPP